MFSRLLGGATRGAPVVARLMVGGMMIVHGADKLAGEPAMFGKFLDEELFSTGGVLGWLVILLEFVGGIFLVVGFASRLVALLFTLELVGAILVVTGERGLIGAEMVGFERDLAYIASFLVVFLAGPGKPSIDHALGIERGAPALVDGSVAQPQAAHPRPG
jgi:putative oxidoreductase